MIDTRKAQEVQAEGFVPGIKPLSQRTYRLITPFDADKKVTDFRSECEIWNGIRLTPG
jgi:hypothetical protein